jgi:hypothetical protein|tara:strand:- start:1864 stop:2325 length:462 start_codon:yes stop_codon:yes gene_type:complete
MGLFGGNRMSKVKTCQDRAVSQGMILGEPNTAKWVINCANNFTGINKHKKTSGINSLGWWGNKDRPNANGPQLKACQDAAVTQGMVLGQPNTVQWVLSCLKNPGVNTATTVTTNTPTTTTAGFMGLPNIVWIAIAGGVIYYGNKKGMFKKILK